MYRLYIWESFQCQKNRNLTLEQGVLAMTFCDDENVVYLHDPVWQPLAGHVWPPGTWNMAGATEELNS